MYNVFLLVRTNEYFSYKIIRPRRNAVDEHPVNIMYLMMFLHIYTRTWSSCTASAHSTIILLFHKRRTVISMNLTPGPVEHKLRFKLRQRTHTHTHERILRWSRVTINYIIIIYTVYINIMYPRSRSIYVYNYTSPYR